MALCKVHVKPPSVEVTYPRTFISPVNFRIVNLQFFRIWTKYERSFDWETQWADPKRNSPTDSVTGQRDRNGSSYIIHRTLYRLYDCRNRLAPTLRSWQPKNRQKNPKNAGFRSFLIEIWFFEVWKVFQITFFLIKTMLYQWIVHFSRFRLSASRTP